MELPDKPITREEQYLDYIAKKIDKIAIALCEGKEDVVNSSALTQDTDGG